MADPSQVEKGAPSPGPGEANATSAPLGREYYYKLLAMLLLAALTCLLLVSAPWATETTRQSREQSTAQLAEMMFGPFGSSFVLLSMAMGVAIIGGLFLAREDPAEEVMAPPRGVRKADGPGASGDGDEKRAGATDERANGGGGPA